MTQNLDDAVLGFKDGLKDRGIEAEFHYLNADGFEKMLPGLANSLAAKKVDLIFACSTPAALAAKELPFDIPVVFTPVFDPLGAGLIENLTRPGGKVTGVSGMVKAGEKVGFIKKLLPDAKTIGILYHKKDPNACLEKANFSEACENIFTLVKLPINKAEDLSSLPDMLRLNKKLDAIFLPIGRIIEENFPSVSYYAETAGLPVIASHAPNIPAGALGGLVANHYLLGRDSAGKAAEILAKTSPAVIPVGLVEKPEILLNAFTAASLNITIPAELLTEAKEIYE